MKKIKLDQSKLLGFKILPQVARVGEKPGPITDTTISGKIGAKPGGRPMPRLAGKIGGKLGAKVGAKGRRL